MSTHLGVIVKKAIGYSIKELKSQSCYIKLDPMYQTLFEDMNAMSLRLRKVKQENIAMKRQMEQYRREISILKSNMNNLVSTQDVPLQ
jgi:hypothetical protein